MKYIQQQLTNHLSSNTTINQDTHLKHWATNIHKRQTLCQLLSTDAVKVF